MDDLTYDQVHELVAQLPPKTIADLARGPLPDGAPDGACGVCTSLSWLTVDPTGTTMRLPYGLTAPHPAACALVDWHEISVFDLVAMSATPELGPPRMYYRLPDRLSIPAASNSGVCERGSHADIAITALAGKLSYARCATIYAIAAGATKPNPEEACETPPVP